MLGNGWRERRPNRAEMEENGLGRKEGLWWREMLRRSGYGMVIDWMYDE